ncbi:MAG: ABC transporter ATP-binding protein [Anaerolineae bacterium]
MKFSSSSRSHLTRRVKSDSRKRPNFIPDSIRNVIRLLSGGEQASARMVRGLLWKFRFFALLLLAASLLAALFEGGSYALFTVALEMLSADASGSALVSLGTLGAWLARYQARLTPQQMFLLLVGVAVAAQLIRTGLTLLGKTAAAFLTAWSEGDLRRRLFHCFMEMDYAQVSRYKTGDLAVYMDQVTQVGRLLMSVSNLVSLLLVVLAYVSLLFWLSWQITLGVLAGLALLSLSMRRIIRRVRRFSQWLVDSRVGISEQVVEFLTGIRLIHLFHRADFAVAETTRVIDEGVRARRLAAMWSGMVNPLVEGAAVLGLAAFLLAGSWLAQRDGGVSPARLGMFVFVMYRLLPRVSTLNGFLATISATLPFADRVAGMLAKRDEERVAAGTQPFIRLSSEIRFENVTLRYAPGDDPALDGVSFTIRRGQSVAFVGASGAGKTSMVNLLLRLYDPTDGRILVDGVDLRDLRLADWRGVIGVVDQDTFLFNRSIADNIRLGKPSATDAEVRAAAQIANAHEFIGRFPERYETMAGNRGANLSGGQRQRIAIARAVIRNPQLLIFDEATSALDSESERLIQAALARIRQERTVIVIAHRLATVTAVGQIFVLEGGRIVESGSHECLLRENGRYARLWRLQSEGADGEV